MAVHTKAKECNEACTIKKEKSCWGVGEVLVCFECVGFFWWDLVFGFFVQLEGKGERYSYSYYVAVVGGVCSFLLWEG